jgi:hypothetical protein
MYLCQILTILTNFWPNLFRKHAGLQVRFGPGPGMVRSHSTQGLPVLITTCKATCNGLLIKYPDTSDLKGCFCKDIIALALSAQEKSGVKPDGQPVMLYSDASILYGTPTFTLQNWAKGSKAPNQAHAH